MNDVDCNGSRTLIQSWTSNICIVQRLGDIGTVEAMRNKTVRQLVGCCIVKCLCTHQDVDEEQKSLDDYMTDALKLGVTKETFDTLLSSDPNGTLEENVSCTRQLSWVMNIILKICLSVNF